MIFKYTLFWSEKFRNRVNTDRSSIKVSFPPQTWKVCIGVRTDRLTGSDELTVRALGRQLCVVQRKNDPLFLLSEILAF
jgi:hypothetical protein